MTGRKRQKMIRIEECILYRDFAEGEVLRDMTILVETYKKLVNAQISLKDRRFRENMSAYEPQFYEALTVVVINCHISCSFNKCIIFCIKSDSHI